MKFTTILPSLAFVMAGASHAAEISLEDGRETYLSCAATPIQARLFTSDRSLIDQMGLGTRWFTQRAVQQDSDAGVPQEEAITKAVQETSTRGQRLMIELLSRGAQEITTANFPQLGPCLHYYQSKSRGVS